MKYIVEFAVCCHKGKVRTQNQDNFWSTRKFLERENNGLTAPLVGTVKSTDTPTFAVFDGMGGEQQGEVAAFIASETFNSLHNNKAKTEPKHFLLDSCMKMNEKICEYAKVNGIRHMGTTAVLLMFDGVNVFVCNIGDSRCYRYRKNQQTLLSCDHIETGVIIGKPPLTQNLGIPKTDFLIEPYIVKSNCCLGDKYLLCSDGLTDMVSEEEISKIMSENSGVAECNEVLLQKALNAGGKDNITIILCQIQKQNHFFKFNKN